jgi:2'-5' RNA ligase
MDPQEGPGAPIDVYALVSYVPGALGKFLDGVRRDLVPSCEAQSHVTVLPPRPLQGTPEEAREQLREQLAGVGSFAVELREVSVFPNTLVVFLDIGAGVRQLRSIHDELNTAGLAYAEPYEYCPHITLAQDFPRNKLDALKAEAERRWREYGGERSFRVEELMFVQNTSNNVWLDLASYPLRQAETAAPAEG